ncbi:HAMP domain-containing histidine kinase [candidate division KSB1 bacterium]|nr:HAMP domain-containing histidine kinase [candidate division KSB1 bacterium]
MEKLEKQFQKHVKWLIHIRWGWIVFVSLAIITFHQIFSIDLPILQLIILLFVLGIYNLTFVLLMRKLTFKKFEKFASLLIRSQLFIDFLLLALFLHYTGGIENPIAIYFIFHVIMSSFLLNKNYAYQHTIFGVLLFISIALLEYFSVIPHYPVFDYTQNPLFTNTFYVICVLLAFSSALFFATFMGTTISGEIKRKDKILEKANKVLQEQDKIKSEYVLMISHDLHEPIATVQNCIQIVLDGYCGNCDPGVTQTLKRATKWTDKMIHLIRDLASLSNLNVMVSINLEPLCINKTITNILKDFDQQTSQKSINLKYKKSSRNTWIAADKEIFSHILTNLISNAIKYTPENGTIGIDLSGHKTKVLLEIWDTGIGIPAKYQEKVFQDFFRTPDAIKYEKDGTGLGLSIVKLGLSLHNAKIKIKSPHDKLPKLHTGTSFILEFPAIKEIE